MPEKEKIYLTQQEQQQYLDLIYNLKTSISPGMVKHYQAQLDELVLKGKMRAASKENKEISKSIVVNRLLGINKLTISEIADVVDLLESEVLHVKKQLKK